MFEQQLEDMHASIYIHERHAKEADAQGIKLWEGDRRISSAEALEIVTKMKRLRVNVPKYQLRRWDSLTNQIRNAFGPEFWEITQ